MTLLNKLSQFFRGRDHDWLEFFLAMLKIVWGAWYLLPFDTFRRVPSSTNLQTLLPENAWGIFFLTLGTAQLIFVIADHMFLKMRARLALFSLFLWLLVTGMAIYGNPYAPAVPSTAVFALANVFIYFKLKAIQNTIST